MGKAILKVRRDLKEVALSCLPANIKVLAESNTPFFSEWCTAVRLESDIFPDGVVVATTPDLVETVWQAGELRLVFQGEVIARARLVEEPQPVRLATLRVSDQLADGVRKLLPDWIEIKEQTREFGFSEDPHLLLVESSVFPPTELGETLPELNLTVGEVLLSRGEETISKWTTAWVMERLEKSRRTEGDLPDWLAILLAIWVLVSPFAVAFLAAKLYFGF